MIENNNFEQNNQQVPQINPIQSNNIGTNNYTTDQLLNSNNTIPSNNQPNQNQKPKSSKKGLIIIIILIIAIIGVVLVFVKPSADKNDNNNSNNNGNTETNNNVKGAIKQIVIDSYGEVAAIDNNNDLYIAFADKHSDSDYKYFGYTEKPTYPFKAASNVKTVYGVFQYIDNNNDYYNTHYRIGGGVHRNFEKIYSNVKDAAQSANLCVLIINENNELYARGGTGQCGLYKTSDYTLMASNVKKVINTTYYNSFYITNNNELYMITYDESVKVMDNVKNITQNGTNHFYIQTTNNELHELVIESEEISYAKYKYNIAETKKIADNILGFGEDWYKLSDGTMYIRTDLCWYDDVTGVFTCNEKDLFAKTTITDIDTVLSPVSSLNGYKMVYKATNGKIKLVTIKKDRIDYNEISSIEKEETVDYAISSLDEIANFYYYNK